MNVRINRCLIVGFTLAVVCSAREEYARTFQKTVSLPAGHRLDIQHRLGDVTIRTHARPEVAVSATIYTSADSATEAKDLSDRITISVVPSTSSVLIRTDYPKEERGLFGRRNTSYSVRYEITMPETAPLEVRNSFGSVNVSDLKAGSTIANSHGALIFRNGRGSQRLENSFGRVEVMGNEGEVTVQNSNDSVTVSNVNGPASVRNRFGKVALTHIGGEAQVVNSNGSVELTDVGGTSTITNSFGSAIVSNVRAGITIRNGNGDVEARTVSGPAELITSFASVRFSDIVGAVIVRATNSRVTGTNAGDFATIETSFGGVDFRGGKKGARIVTGNSGVTLADIAGDTYVKASFGNVRTERIGGILTVDSNNGAVTASGIKGARISASFGGVELSDVTGTVQVESSNGSVVVRPRPVATSCLPIAVKTSFAPVKLYVAKDANYDLTARTSFGNISTDMPVTVSGSLGKDSLTGKIGKGGCEMRVVNSNGSIEIAGKVN